MSEYRKIIVLSFLVIFLAVATALTPVPKPKTTSSLSSTPILTSPTPDLLGNWQTFTGNNFTIQYPSSWNILNPTPDKNSDYTVVRNETSPYGEVVINGPHQGPFGTDKKSFTTQVSNYVDYYISSTSDLGNFQPEITSKKNITIDGRKGLVYTIAIKDPIFSGDGKPPFYITRWLFVPTNKTPVGFYHIRLNGDNPLLDQILSTFKFLDQLPPTSNSEIIYCGGFTGALCPSGYTCEYPKTGSTLGKCVKT